MSPGILRRALPTFVLASLAAGAVLFLLYRDAVQTYRKTVETDEAQAVDVAKQRTIAGINAGLSDTLVLADQETLAVWLETGDPEILRRLAINFQSLVRHRAIYDQARFIDGTGHERLRVNRIGSGAEIVPAPLLQDKSSSYYVPEIRRLAYGEVYVSPLDLNVENGRIEEPHKPVVRFGVPVFDRAGARAGMVVLNYNAQIVLDRIRGLDPLSQGRLWLVNRDGHWLLGPRPEDEWAFMFDDRAERNFAASFPKAWAAVATAHRNAQLTIDGDLFTFAWITPGAMASAPGAAGRNLVGGEPTWAIVSRVPAALLSAREAEAGFSFGVFAIVVLTLNAIGAWLLARHRLARETAEATIRRSEVVSRSLLEAAPDAVIITDTGGRIVRVNAQTERLFGYTRDELIGTEVWRLLSERHRDRFRGGPPDTALDTRPRLLDASLDIHAVRRDGSEFPVAISINSAQIDGETMVFADVRNISRLRRAEHRVRELNAQLQRDNASLDQTNRELEAFSYSVSHDLRAPLRAIDGFSQALLEDYADKVDDAGRDYLNRVRAATQRMGELIDDLLKLARVTRTEMDTADVDLSALAREVAAEVGAREPGRDVELTVEPGIVVHGDPRLLRVALENLLGNAWKFTGGRGPARIAFGRRESSGETVVFVRDNGAGFDMAYAGKLFGAFQRLHGAREFPGTGIGLATVQRIVHKHGGRIWADAEPGKGATFSFTLPLTAAGDRAPEGRVAAAAQ
ncbi:MAG: ATP-binding protein [Rhodospirillaceae bacterium]